MLDREIMIRLKEDRYDDERLHLIRIRNDILWFCDAMYRLVIQVKLWLRNKSIMFSDTFINLTDKSVTLWPDSRPICYEISKLNMRKHGAEVELIPLSLYSEVGSRGQVQLKTTSCSNKICNQLYILSLDRATSTWSIRQQEESCAKARLLDKDTFQSAVSVLSKAKRN